MTVLHVLGSGSRGNCFLLEADGRVLLLDAGFSARELTRRAEEAGVSLAAAVGIALTHEHGDHFNADILDALKTPSTTLIVNQRVADMLPGGMKKNLMRVLICILTIKN